MATIDRAGEEDGRVIRLEQQPDGGWTAVDEATGVASEGDTRHEALDILDDALAAYHGEGSAVTGEELREMGVDPDMNDPSRGSVPPWADEAEGNRDTDGRS